MRRGFILMLVLLVGTIQTYATILPIIAGEDTIEKQIKWVKEMLESNEWHPTNKSNAIHIANMLQFIENPPIDTINKNLKQANLNELFNRDIEQIQTPEKINGYVQSIEINRKFIEIENEVEERISDKSILVPEEEYVGMYAKIPIITQGNIDELFERDLIVIPDSLQPVENEKPRFRNQADTSKVMNLDSLRLVYIDSVRRKYNDSIITVYRDSIAQNYRVNYKRQIADSMKQAYANLISAQNKVVLNRYNDSVAAVLNQKVENVLSSLISYANRVPNTITILSQRNNPKELQLRNDDAWYEWLWLKNDMGDSIGIRVDNLNRNTIRVIVDESVNLSRLTQKETLDIEVLKPTIAVNHHLQKIKNRNPELSSWKFGGKAYGGFTQTYINDYWAKGGNSSASMLSTFNYFANYMKPKFKWENSFDFKLGMVYYIGDTTSLRKSHKSNDNFDLSSKLGVSAFKKWYYSTDFEFKTQIFRGYGNRNETKFKSTFFTPAYLNFSIGLDYKPSKDLSVFLSPVSLKTTFVPNDTIDGTLYGLEPDEKRRSRIGATGKLNLSKSITEDISIRTKNSLFINFGKNSDGEGQMLKFPDLDSETTINFQVNQFISTQLNMHFVYDKDLKSEIVADDGTKKFGTKMQVKEFFTLGISYKF